MATLFGKKLFTWFVKTVHMHDYANANLCRISAKIVIHICIYYTKNMLSEIIDATVLKQPSLNTKQMTLSIWRAHVYEIENHTS